MGIRDLLRNLFGRNRSAEPNQEPESSPAEQHAAPQTAQEKNEPEHGDKQHDDTDTARPDATPDARPDATPDATPHGEQDGRDERDGRDEVRENDAAPAASSTSGGSRAEDGDADADDAEDAEDADDDPNRVPSPRFAADDVSKDADSETSSTADRSESATSPGKTTSEDFLDSVAGASHDESPDLSGTRPARPDTVSSNGASADTSSPEPAADTEADADAEPEPRPEAADEQTTAHEPAAEDRTADEPAADTSEPELTEPRTATVPQQASEPTEASTRATTETSENATAAVSLEKLQASAPGLVSLYKAAAVSLEKRGIAGQRAAVYLVLDRSGSMRRYYKDGTVQHLAEQVLGLSAHLDDDGTVPVVFFSTDIDGADELDLANYSGRIEELHASYGHMGRTNYHRAVEAVIEHYEQSGATEPALVIFQTDGAPTSRAAAEKALCDAANKPLFWQFIGFGDPKSAGLNFLKKLDSGLPVPEKRAVDNAGFFHAGLEPRSLSDAELYDALTEEFPQWLEAVREAQIHA